MSQRRNWGHLCWGGVTIGADRDPTPTKLSYFQSNRYRLSSDVTRRRFTARPENAANFRHTVQNSFSNYTATRASGGSSSCRLPNAFLLLAQSVWFQLELSNSFSASPATEPIDQNFLLRKRLTERGKHNSTDSLLLAAQVVFNQLVSSDIACVHTRDRMVHEELGIEFGNAGNGGNRPKCLTKVIAPF